MTGTAGSGGRLGLRGAVLPRPAREAAGTAARTGEPRGSAGEAEASGAAEPRRRAGRWGARSARHVLPGCSRARTAAPCGQGWCHGPAAGRARPRGVTLPGMPGRGARPAPGGQLWQEGKAAVRLPGSRTSDLYLMEYLFLLKEKFISRSLALPDCIRCLPALFAVNICIPNF